MNIEMSSPPRRIPCDNPPMDWKRFYADELASPGGRAAVESALERHAGGDAAVVDALRSGGVISFPHVTLRDSADPIARVAQSILAADARGVVALGVLHGGALPEPHRSDVAEFHRGGPRAAEIFRRLGGAFVERGAARTLFGEVPDGPMDRGLTRPSGGRSRRSPAAGDVVREDASVLVGEFSLDLFLASLAAAAGRRGVAPPPTTRVFVSVTRDADGSFAAAGAIADAVRPLLESGAVCVATGDLVHYGNSYTPAGEMAGLPADATSLAARLRPRIDAMHEAALSRRDFAAAYAAGSEIRSDQRHLLPVIAGLVGRGARADVLSFAMSDYAAINGVASPCFVASALVAFRRRA